MLLLLALAGCLNPQPDPFPQNADGEVPPQRSSAPNDVQLNPSVPPPGNATAGSATTPSPARDDNAEQAPAPMSATPSSEGGGPADAGAPPADAGAELDAGVPANGF